MVVNKLGVSFTIDSYLYYAHTHTAPSPLRKSAMCRPIQSAHRAPRTLV